MQALHIQPGVLPPRAEALRHEVRDFIAQTLPHLSAAQRARNWNGHDPAFSRLLGQRGWIGMTWPQRYGGAGRSALERYVVMEELLAAGAPVAAHWIADRQSGPLLMRFSPELWAPRLAPKIARGEAFFCIGMSEPDSGSDLASIRTKAVGQGEHWVLTGRKVWTSFAHKAHYMIALVRTGANDETRHAGMSQFLIDMTAPGLTLRPILSQLGEHEFNEVTFDDVRVPAENLIGEEGDGWRQVGTELAFERSGPERYMSSTQLVVEMLKAAQADDTRQAVALGRVVAQYATLRQMSLGVAGMLADGVNPAQAAAAVKDQGALLEQGLPDIAHDLFGGAMTAGSDLAEVARYLTLAAPSFSLRGGTREILRGILAKGLGLR